MQGKGGGWIVFHPLPQSPRGARQRWFSAAVLDAALLFNSLGCGAILCWWVSAVRRNTMPFKLPSIQWDDDIHTLKRYYSHVLPAYLLSTYRFSKGKTRDWRKHRTRCPWKIPSTFGEERRILIILVWRLKRGWKSFVWCSLPDSDAAESSEEELSLVRFSSCYWIRMVEYCPVNGLDWNGFIFCCYWIGLEWLHLLPLLHDCTW